MTAKNQSNLGQNTWVHFIEFIEFIKILLSPFRKWYGFGIIVRIMGRNVMKTAESAKDTENLYFRELV